MQAPPKLSVTTKQYHALCAVCNVFVPPVNQPNGNDDTSFWQLKASDTQVPHHILELVAQLPPAEQSEIKQLLTLLASPLFGLTCFKGLKSINAMPFKQRETALQSWSGSRFVTLRKAFNALRKLTTFIHYGISHIGHDNPNWKHLKYPGPISAPPQLPKPMQPFFPPNDLQLTADVVVIGSGAGGGLAAGMLAQAGYEVIVLEKGDYLSPSDLNQREVEMIQRTFEQKGALTTADGGVSVFAGSCLGGGTTVNWTAAIPTPDYILQEWATQHQLPHLLTTHYQHSMKAVMEAAGVTQSESNHNIQNRYLWRGSEMLGNTPKVVPRNVSGCNATNEGKSCGYCCLGGCQANNKNSTLKTWLQQAYQHGAKIMTHATAQKIKVKKGKVIGVEAIQHHPSGRTHSISIKAPLVVLAAGALHTPALLLKSGIRHPHIGQHLYLHPTVLVSGYYPQVVNPWFGAMISSINDTDAHLEGHFGARIETPPIHPGLWAMAAPWHSAIQHKSYMLKIAHSANLIVLTRDKFGGSVQLNSKGFPVLSYPVHHLTVKHLLVGIEKAARILLATGAEEVTFPHHVFRHVTHNTTETALKKFFAQMPEWGWKSGQFSLFSAHQMGTCRMGADAKTHPLNPQGEVNGVKGLFVADASALPAASGVNPMMSIMALSHYTIKQLIASGK
ncbi:MAG TPA: FAD-dependent oxidoreductase [Chitinophagales bacterium]|nr:FAD-dependent oxidoreductase [Chitinophagales bacterium]HRK26815.1 FAD-dependent oxidoreductase [Chitinophagales bacterium]